MSIVGSIALAIGGLGDPGLQGRAEAASANPFADLGLPAIAVTITDEAFEGVPATLEAGRYVLSVTNTFRTSTEETEGAALLRLPDGVSAGEFIALVDEETDAWPPTWYYETLLAGGPYAALGATAFAVIDLPAGTWILWSEVPGSPQVPVPITVAGEFPDDPQTPPADAAIELSEFHIAFLAPLAPGQRVLQVVNAGSQPHFVFIGGVPAGTTVAEAQAAFDAFWNPESAPPAPFSFAETPEYFAAGDQAAGTTAWYAVDLPVGTAVVACFATDPKTGLSHEMLGMTEIVEIG